MIKKKILNILFIEFFSSEKYTFVPFSMFRNVKLCSYALCYCKIDVHIAQLGFKSFFLIAALKNTTKEIELRELFNALTQKCLRLLGKVQ